MTTNLRVWGLLGIGAVAALIGCGGAAGHANDQGGRGGSVDDAAAGTRGNSGGAGGDVPRDSGEADATDAASSLFDANGVAGSGGSVGAVDAAAAGGTSGAGGGGTAGAGGTPAGGGIPPASYGKVSVDGAVAPPFIVYSASATFNSDENPGCDVRVVNDCQILRCPRTDAGAPAARPSPHVGVISITGGSRPYTLMPGADGNYGPDAGLGTAWEPGARLTFSAAGGTIPAFPTSVLEAPHVISSIRVNGTSPATSPGRNTLIRTAGAHVDWSGGTGTVNLGVNQTLADSYRILLCYPAAAAGTYTFYAALLGELLPGDATLAITQTTSTVVMAGPHTVSLILSTNPQPRGAALTIY